MRGRNVGHDLIRRIIGDPGHRDVRLDSGHIDELVGIKDPQTPIVKLEDAILAQIAEHAIDVDAGEAGRIADMLLG
jgi:hypothetical protein